MAVQQRQFLDWRSSHGLDFGDDALTPLLEAQAWRESRGKHRDEATGELTSSPVGALGLTQIMPDTASHPGWGVAPLQDDSVEESIRFQRDYMTAMLRHFDGDVPRAVAAYNAGAGNVNAAVAQAEMEGTEEWWNFLPMPQETVPYMEEILGNLHTIHVNGQEVEPEQIADGAERLNEILSDMSEEELIQTFQDVPGHFEVEGDEETQETVQEVMDQIREAYREGMEGEAEYIYDPVLDHHVRKPPDPIPDATDSDLYGSEGWINSSWEMYTFWNHRPPPDDMSNEDLAEWGLQFMSNLEWSILRLGRVSHRFSNLYDLRAKMALNHMMDQMEEKEASGRGFWRGTKAFFTDPFNVLGISSFGTATAGKLALQQAAIQTFRQGIKQSLQRSGIVLGIEGALYSGVHNTAYQNLEIKLDRRDEFSHLEAATSTAIGAVAGAAIGTGYDQLAGRIAQRMQRNKLSSRGAAGRAGSTRLSAEEMEELKRILDPEDFKQLELEQSRLRLEGAKWKKPVGRSPEDDDVTFVNYASERRLKKLGLSPARVYEGFRHTPRNLAEAADMARPLAQALRGLSTKNVSAVIEGIRRMSFRDDQLYNMKEATGQAWLSLHVERARLLNQFHNVETNPQRLAQLSRQIQENEELYTPIRLMHEAMGSEAGALLRAERGRGKLRRMEVNEIKRQNPRMTDRDADQFFIDMTKRFEVDEAIRKVNSDYRANIDDALNRADWDKAKALWQAREAEIDRLNDLIPDYMRDDLGYNKWARRQNASMSGFERFKDVSERLNELFISNVFSTTTVLINLVPSGLKALAKPGVEMLFKNPLERRTWVETFATYNAMSSGMRAAAKSAALAFKYEQSLLTGGHMRLLENHLTNMGTRNPKLWDWINNIRSSVPGAMRFFPRMLNATDEALSRISYDGYVAGRAAGEAYADAISQGVERRAARKVAQKAARQALVVKENADTLDRKINILISKGRNAGYEGVELQRYVLKNFDDMKHMKVGEDYSAVQYARDVLYKKNFDENTSLGKTGIWAENLMKDQPWIKWVTGQLFFRTPIRVVEEGLRYTPFFQYLMPQFRRDLMGLNGDGRYAAAMGQQMMSLVFASVVVLKYAEGEVQGANISRGKPDYRHRRLRYDAAGMEDYNIDLFGTGNHWSYRMFDPIATPFKVMVNTLEFFDHLKIREAQGEFIDNEMYRKAMGMFSGSTLPAIMAVADANLFGGITTTTRILSGLENIEGDNNRFYHLMSERLRWLQPNTAHKMARLQDGEFRDPSGVGAVGLGQNVMTGLGSIGMLIEEHYEMYTPRAYDIFGNTRQLTNRNALFNLFGTSTPEDRMGNYTPEQLVVLDELTKLQARTNTYYHSQHTHRETGDLDLRTVRTKDGKWTLYDRWNQILSTLPLDRVLFQILMEQGIPEGVPGNPSDRVRYVQETIRDFRDEAFGILMQEQEEVILPHIQRHDIMRDLQQQGAFDAGRRRNTPTFPDSPWN